MAGTTFTANFGSGSANALTNTTGNEVSYSYITTATGQGNLALTATSRKFNIAPGSLTNLSQTTVTGLVNRTTPGLGIAAGGSGEQIDTNSPGSLAAPQREGLLLTGDKRFSIHSVKLSSVDVNDTFQLYGVAADNSLVNLGFGTTTSGPAGNPGTINGGLDGTASGFVFSGANGGTASFNIPPTSLFSAYLFTTRIGGDVTFGGDGGQGYRLDSISGALPEPGTWAMLIGGFGIAGVSLRRQRKAVAA